MALDVLSYWEWLHIVPFKNYSIPTVVALELSPARPLSGFEKKHNTNTNLTCMSHYMSRY